MCARFFDRFSTRLQAHPAKTCGDRYLQNAYLTIGADTPANEPDFARSDRGAPPGRCCSRCSCSSGSSPRGRTTRSSRAGRTCGVLAPGGRAGQLRQARSGLYRRRLHQVNLVNVHFATFSEIRFYKIFSLVHRSELNKSAYRCRICCSVPPASDE